MDRERRISAHRGPGEDPGQLSRLHARLLARLETLAPALIALSGGVDSRLLCTLAAQTSRPGDFAAVHFSGPHVPDNETERARGCCQELGLQLFELPFDPCSVAPVRLNTTMRCYYCKRELLSRLLDAAKEKGYSHVLDGSNASDRTQHRPGLQALEEFRELGVTSPLADAGLEKEQVRVLARGVGMPLWEQPARPCLLTRLAYDLPADPDLLALLDKGEALLMRGGFRDFRLRVPEHGRMLLQLAEAELDLWELQGEAALELLAEMGLHNVELQVAKQVSGWYDSKKTQE